MDTGAGKGTVKISVFGLGYVGTVTAACLARDGHDVVGIDVQASKVDLINRGLATVIEEDLEEIIAESVASKRLRASSDTREAVLATELSLICVGTPSQSNGNLDVSQLRRVCEEIAAALPDKADFHVVAVRSTILPGTMRQVVIPVLEATSGKRATADFGVCNNPEFLREGSAVADFYNPPRTVIGQRDDRSGDLMASLYEKIDAPLVRTDMEVAEILKYADNAWHALKIGFANEIGNICKSLAIDSHKLMEVFCIDRKLNLSSTYLLPGFAFGGSCLPKDLRALTYRGRTLDLDLPILNAILPSNRQQIERAIRMVIDKGSKKVGVLGFSFKAGTDDLRESPMVEVVERLIGKGYDIRLFDHNVNLAKLVGANRDYILNHIPHISQLMVTSIDEVLDHAETVVIGTRDPEFRSILARLRPQQVLIDFVRLVDAPAGDSTYDGICW
jgi:GDP-mannose 6-dehydrogenase